MLALAASPTSPTRTTVCAKVYMDSEIWRGRNKGRFLCKWSIVRSRLLIRKKVFLKVIDRILPALKRQSTCLTLTHASVNNQIHVGTQVFPTAAYYKPGDIHSSSALRVVLEKGYVYVAMFDGLCGSDSAFVCKVRLVTKILLVAFRR
jgi:hypothetical protein